MTTDTAAPASRIVKVLRVIDTRDYEEVEPERWKPIPGSGCGNVCARCSRVHEVHVYVELANGDAAIVGTSCCKGESTDVQSRIKSATSAAQTARRLEVELVAAQAKLANYEAAHAEISARPRPAVIYGSEVLKCGFRKGEAEETMTVGDVTVPRFLNGGYTDPAERMGLLRLKWIDKRMTEAGFTCRDYMLKDLVADIDKRLRRARTRIEGSAA